MGSQQWLLTQQLVVLTCAAVLSHSSKIILPLSLQLLQITALWWRRRRPSSATTTTPWPRSRPTTSVESWSAPSWLSSKSFASGLRPCTARWVGERLEPTSSSADAGIVSWMKSNLRLFSSAYRLTPTLSPSTWDLAAWHVEPNASSWSQAT